MLKKTKAFFYFKNNQKLDKQVLLAVQNEKLRQVVEHAYHTTPFYKELMDRSNVKPEDIQGAGDLKKIPPITKTEVQNRYNDFISNKYNIND